MNYQSGRMGIAEGLALAFIITFPPIFLSIPTKSVEAAGTMGWMPGTIGALLGSLLLYLYSIVMKHHPGDLLSVFQKLLGRPVGLLVGLYYFILLFGLAVLWTRQFAESTLLTALPLAAFDVVVLWYGLGAAALVYAGIEAMCRASYVILPFGITALLLVFALLLPMYKPMYLLPLLGNGLASAARPTINLIGASAQLALLFILAPAFHTIRTLQMALAFGYGGSAVVRVSAVTVYIMLFGAAVGAEKTLPFFEMARLIYLNRYIQRLEAIFILLWAIIGIIAIAICLYGSLYVIAKIFKLPTIRPLIPAGALIMIQLAMLPPDTNSVLLVEAAFLGFFCAPGAALFPVILLAVHLWKGRRKVCKTTASD